MQRCETRHIQWHHHCFVHFTSTLLRNMLIYNFNRRSNRPWWAGCWGITDWKYCNKSIKSKLLEMKVTFNKWVVQKYNHLSILWCWKLYINLNCPDLIFVSFVYHRIPHADRFDLFLFCVFPYRLVPQNISHTS